MTRRRAEYSSAYETLRKTLRYSGLPCSICGKPIDYDLPYKDPYTGKVNKASFTIDHVKPLSKHPELASDPGNLKPAHWICNKRKGDKPLMLGLGLKPTW